MYEQLKVITIIVFCNSLEEFKKIEDTYKQNSNELIVIHYNNSYCNNLPKDEVQHFFINNLLLDTLCLAINKSSGKYIYITNNIKQISNSSLLYIKNNTNNVILFNSFKNENRIIFQAKNYTNYLELIKKDLSVSSLLMLIQNESVAKKEIILKIINLINILNININNFIEFKVIFDFLLINYIKDFSVIMNLFFKNEDVKPYSFNKEEHIRIINALLTLKDNKICPSNVLNIYILRLKCLYLNNNTTYSGLKKYYTKHNYYKKYINNHKQFYKNCKINYIETQDLEYLNDALYLGFKYCLKITRRIVLYKLKNLIKIVKYKFFIYHKLKSLKFLNKKVLVVIPSNDIKSSEKRGFVEYKEYYDYFNPNSYFDYVFIISPLESGFYKKYGLYICEASPKTYNDIINIIKPKVIRAYGGFWATSFAIKHTENKSIPIITSIHDKRIELIYPSVLKSNYIFYTSHIIKDILLNLGLKANNLLYLPDRINLDNFSKITEIDKKPTEIDKNYINILTVGRLSEEKNIDTVIKALQYLPANYRLIIIGKGDKKHYNNLATKLNVGSKIKWIESVENSKLKYYYSFADCFCLLSKSEGFGIVFIEAAACKIPIIASNINPINKHFKNGKDAVLINDYTNPKEVAKTIQEVLSDDSFASMLCLNGINVANAYGGGEIAKKERKYYNSIIKLKE